MAQGGRQTYGDASLENWDYMCKGGFGLVFKARLKDSGINVVVKLIDRDDDGYDGNEPKYRHKKRLKQVITEMDRAHSTTPYGIKKILLYQDNISIETLS